MAVFMQIRLRSSSLYGAALRGARSFIAPVMCAAVIVANVGEVAAQRRERDSELRIVPGTELAQVQPLPPVVAPPAPVAAPANPATVNPASSAPPTVPPTTTNSAPANTAPANTAPTNTAPANSAPPNNAVAQANQPNLVPRAGANNSRSFSLARVPNMIGDQTGGGGAQIQTTGLVPQSVSHPNLGNSRLNVAENNSPVIGDRCYFTYRHFESASSVDYLNGLPTGGAASQNIDRIMFGIERQLTDMSSLEFRLPFNAQLDSNLLFSQFAGPTTSTPYGATNFELGNINLIFKQALIDSDGFYLSGGVGLNIPTAPDVTVRTRVDDPAYRVFDSRRNPPAFLGTAAVNLDSTTVVRNQTVNLSPYFGGAFRPSERSFVQGFLQWDLPLNRSGVSLDETLIVNTLPAARQNFQGRLEQQILMRANVGVGHWWRYRERSRYFHSIATMFEAHYTTSLNDAQTTGPFTVATNLPAVFTQTTVGNIANRIDVVNLVAGVPVMVGATTFTNAFTVPVRGGLNRSFDFEYSLIIDRRF
ncbi:MAG: hypothetical protein K8U03_16210 [Planctomycetia bacterium]|nr:hypothetical protein [Planctomycetia bacterium]